ncbi:MAG: tyrosine recombinase XerC [Clostridia bacterium]|nr:tyrosine recombinase XerC [Clostridia bacterium]
MSDKIINEMDGLSPPIQSFLGYCISVKNKSAKTVDEYRKDLKTFFRFYKRHTKRVSTDIKFEDIPLDDVTYEMIDNVTVKDLLIYMKYLAETRKNNAATRSRKTSSLRTFYTYLTEYNFIQNNPTAKLHVPQKEKKLPRHLTLEQSIELLKSVDGNYKERDYCILTMFLNCGLRLQELVDINYNDINSDGTLIVKGKGSKERLLYLNQACIDSIADYLKVRPRDKIKNEHKNALFISSQNRRMSASMVQKLVYKYLAKIGLSAADGYSCHKLRHTAATLMYQTGNVDVRVLKEFLGHENLATTQIYTHVSDSQLKDAAFSNPLSKVNINKKSKKE